MKSLQASKRFKKTKAGLIPVDWEVVQLGDIADFKNGINFRAADSGFQFKMLGVGDFQSKTSLRDDACLKSISLSSQPPADSYLIRNDLVFVRSNGSKNLVGRCLQIQYDSINLVYSGFCIRARLFSNKTTARFINLLMQSGVLKKQLVKDGRGTNISNLNQDILSKLYLKLPPLLEQKAISDLLSTWDEAIEKTEKLIQAKEKQFLWLLRELIVEPGKIQKNIEWKKVKLGEVCKLYQPQTISKEDMNETGIYKVFGANGIIGFHDSYNHENAEIVITCRGATCGTLNRTEPKSWITGNAMVAQPNEKKILKDYLYYSLLTANMKSVISGAAQPQITRQDLIPLSIKLTSFEKQQQIAKTLSTAQQGIDILKLLAEKYKIQKRGLMQKLLTGEWRVKR